MTTYIHYRFDKQNLKNLPMSNMQAESRSLELLEGLPLRKKYTNNKAKLFNIHKKTNSFQAFASVSTYSEKIYGLWVPVG